MNNLVYNLVFFIVVYLIVFIFCYFFAGKIKPKKEKGKKKGKSTYKLMNEGKFLILRNNLDEKKVNIKILNIITCSLNAFIIAFTSTIISCINLSLYFRLAIAFVLLFALIYSLFEIVGRILKRKWGKE